MMGQGTLNEDCALEFTIQVPGTRGSFLSMLCQVWEGWEPCIVIK